MMNREWEDFFGVEEVYDMADTAVDIYTGVKKDAVAALASCINTNGYVDMGWMMNASGLALDQLTEALEGAVYQDPEIYDIYHADDQGWILRAQYLSGNIKTKIEIAKEPNRKYNKRFEANVAALKAAMPEKVDFEVIGYLAFDNSRMNTEPDIEELAFPTPRSWEFVRRLLKTTGKSPAEAHGLISGCVGVSNALEFENWCHVYCKLSKVADILAGKCTVRVKESDVIYALISSLLIRISGHKDTISVRELENVCAYASQFPADFSAMFFRGILAIEGMNMQLTKVSSFAAWMKKNRRFL